MTPVTVTDVITLIARDVTIRLNSSMTYVMNLNAVRECRLTELLSLHCVDPRRSASGEVPWARGMSRDVNIASSTSAFRERMESRPMEAFGTLA